MERIDKLKEYLQANPKDSFLRHALALEYIKLGDDFSAQNIFEALLNDDKEYIGSYYHLAKLFERGNETAKAIACYEKGMKMAKAAKDNHAYNELQAAYEDLVY